MPPRPNTPPSNARRRQGPAMSGGWIWLVILATVVGMLFLTQELGTTGTINYSDFVKLARANKISKVTYVGTDRIIGEVKDPEDAEVKKLKLRGNKFTTLMPPFEDKDSDLKNELLKNGV